MENSSKFTDLPQVRDTDTAGSDQIQDAARKAFQEAKILEEEKLFKERLAKIEKNISTTMAIPEFELNSKYKFMDGVRLKETYVEVERKY